MNTPSRITALTHRSLASELRAILAVARKDWIIFRRYPSWIMALLIWPVLLPVAYVYTARALVGPNGSSLAAFSRLAGTSDYHGFIVVGSLLWGWLNMTLWDVGMQLRNEQMRGTLESNWLCPVWRISILVGGSLVRLVISLLFITISVAEFWLVFGVTLLRGNFGLVLLILLLTIPCIYGIGIAFASVVIRFKEANALVFLVRGIFLIFCGMTYPLAVLPGWMQTVGSFLPLTYAIQDIRAAALSNASLAHISGDLTRLAGFAVILPLLGYLAFRSAERRARRTGTLGQY